MKTIHIRLFIALLVIMAAATSYAQAPNLLVVGVDDDRNSVPRDSRVFKLVVSALQDQMLKQGFRVYDETLVTMKIEGAETGRRTQADILDIAASITNPPIDMVFTLSIFANVSKRGYSTRLDVRVQGEMLNVNNKRYLGNFEGIKPWGGSLPPSCGRSRDCILEEVARRAEEIAESVGEVLHRELSQVNEASGSSALGTAYELRFEKFDADEISEIETTLTKFTGYQTHRMTDTSTQVKEIWYEGTTSNTRMYRNLNKLLEVLDVDASLEADDNRFLIRKVVQSEASEASGESEW